MQPRFGMSQQRSFSLWNIPAMLMTASPLKRRLTLVGLGGVGLAITVILGPFLLVGVGGIAAVVGFRLWRFKRQLQQELERQTSSNLNEWPDLLNAFFMQGSSFFGQDQKDIQKETVKRVNEWMDSSQGRDALGSYGIPTDTAMTTEDVSIRGSYSSTRNDFTEIKVELALSNSTSPGSILVTKAIKNNKEGVLDIKDIQLVMVNGQVFHIPLSTQNRNGGRIIEGEYRDVV